MEDVLDFVEKSPEQVAVIEDAMRADGVSPYQATQADYFGFEELRTLELTDGVSYVQHKILNEGERRKYLNAVNRDVRIQRATGDAVMRMSPGDEKKALLEAALVGWNLQRAGQPVPFTKHSVNEFLDKADPRVIDLIEKEVRKANSWLQAEMSVEDIDREITQLQELRTKKVEEEEGKAG